MKTKIFLVFILLFSFHFSLAQTPTYAWAKNVTSFGTDNGMGVAVDGNGYVYQVGILSGGCIIDTTLLPGHGIFLVKYDSLGLAQWARSIGGNGSDFGWGVSVDGNNNVYITGYYSSSSISFGNSITLTGSTGQMFVAKYNSAGVAQWARNCSPYSSGNGIAADINGNVYVTGYFNNSFIVFGTDTVYGYGNEDIFLVKYNTSGVVQWARSYGTAGTDMGKGVTTDLNGNVIFTGYFSGPNINMESNILTSNGGLDIFLGKYDPNGNVIWVKNFGSGNDDIGRSVACDSYGSIALCGSFNSSFLSFGGNTGINNSFSPNTSLGYVVKFDPWCYDLWASGGGNNTSGVTFDPSSNIYITGSFTGGGASFGTFFLPNQYILSSEIFIVKYDAVGTVLWAKGPGTHDDDRGASVATRRNGCVYATGTSFGTITFSPFTLPGQGSDAYMIKISDQAPLSSGVEQTQNGIVVFYADGNINVAIPSTQTESNYFLSILDLTGRILVKKEIVLGTGNYSFDFANGIANGVYLVRLTDKNGMDINKRFIHSN